MNRLAFALAVALSVPLFPLHAHAASLDPAAWRGDARFLVAAVDSLHPQPYRWNKRAAWDSAAADFETRLPTLRYGQALAGFSRLLGLLRDGHSRLDQVQLANHARPTLAPLPGPGFHTSYAIDFEVFADGLRVTRATNPHADLLGAHVVAINGVPLPKVVEALSPVIPTDNALWTLHVLPEFLRSPGYLNAVGLAPSAAAPLKLTLIDRGGTRREAIVAAERPDSTQRWTSADAIVRSALPLTRSLPGPFAFVDLGDSTRTVFVRLREIANASGGETMAQFAARLFAHADSIGCRRLILDLRGNGGGNNYLNQPLVRGLIQRPRLDRVGGLFVIIDRGTFSAAVSLATDLQRETYARFVGEPTGGAPNSFGDPAHVTLPGSGLVVRISTLSWPGSDARDPREFIAPDLPARPRFADWFGHRDPALEAIAAYRVPPGLVDEPPNTRWADPSQLEAKAPAIDW